jgi:signal recognition particle subunit SRP54
MFEIITDKFVKLQRKLLGYGRLSSKEISEALREIRITLLEADVNYKVVGELVRNLQEKIEEKKIVESLKPGELINVTLYQELLKLLGEKAEKIQFSAMPTIICLVGLQGTGKTTTAAKLGVKYKNKKPLLVACDIKRPAASEQLKILAQRAQVDFFPVEENALKTCIKALEQAKTKGNQLVIFDTAGRLHIDEDLMNELKVIKDKTKPHYILLVVDGMVGHDAVNQAQEFHTKLGLSGAIITKLDGDAKGGAVVSIRKVTSVPIYFMGTGERIEDLEEFSPQRISTRIIGQGDILSLQEKVAQAMSPQEQEKVAEKFLKGKFDFTDFLEQLRSVKKMGNISKLIAMIPGASAVKGLENIDDKEFNKTEAIILSMTKQERSEPEIIDGSRRRRIAIGSGTAVEDVNRLLKEFRQAKDMMHNMNTGKFKMFKR